MSMILHGFGPCPGGGGATKVIEKIDITLVAKDQITATFRDKTRFNASVLDITDIGASFEDKESVDANVYTKDQIQGEFN